MLHWTAAWSDTTISLLTKQMEMRGHLSVHIEEQESGARVSIHFRSAT
jgi:hypothetical protein